MFDNWMVEFASQWILALIGT